MMRRSVLLLVLAATALASGQNPNRLYQLSELEKATLTYGKKRLATWVMDTASKRQEGMMFLSDREVPANGAMLFVFPDEQPRAFWMRNTIIPLDIAYLDAKGTVHTVKQLKPRDETGVPSGKPAKYVLEMKKGAMARLGIRPGTRFSIPAAVKSRD